MAAKTSSAAAEAVKQLTYLAGALKAPRITEAAARLADHARDSGWTHEEYLAAGRAIGTALRDIIGHYDIAMTAVEVTALMEDRAKVEIEVTAVVPD